MKKQRRSKLRTALCLLALLCAGALAPLSSEAQISNIPLKFQSDTYQILNRAEYPGGNFEIQYLPKGEDKNDWINLLVITKHAAKSIKDLAIAQAQEVARRKGIDRYSGVLLMESKSKQSIFLDKVISEDRYVETSLVRFFESKNGIYSYRLSRRMYKTRLPADASMANLEIMKFVDRSRLKRSDLIIDFARKRLPFQSPDDPMGMVQLPFEEKKPKR